MSAVHFIRGAEVLSAEHFDAICDLYDEVFSEPPRTWSVDRSTEHRDSLRRLMAGPGFGLVLAYADDQLVGFGYGRTLAVDTTWWNDFLEPVPVEVTTEREGRTFAVIDLGVRRARRSQGIGRKLLEGLLGGRREERATLAVRPDADRSQRFYRHLGWQRVGRLRGSGRDTDPLFDIYVLPLPDVTAQAQLKP